MTTTGTLASAFAPVPVCGAAILVAVVAASALAQIREHAAGITQAAMAAAAVLLCAGAGLLARQAYRIVQRAPLPLDEPARVSVAVTEPLAATDAREGSPEIVPGPAPWAQEMTEEADRLADYRTGIVVSASGAIYGLEDDGEDL